MYFKLLMDVSLVRHVNVGVCFIFVCGVALEAGGQHSLHGKKWKSCFGRFGTWYLFQKKKAE